MKCPFCNSELEEDIRFCPFCGRSVEAYMQDDSDDMGGNQTVYANAAYDQSKPHYQDGHGSGQERGYANQGYQNQGYQNQGYQNQGYQGGDDFGSYNGSGNKGGGNGLRNILLLLIAVCALIVGGLIGFIFVGSKSDSDEKEKESVESVIDEEADEEDSEDEDDEDAETAKKQAENEAAQEAEQEAKLAAEEEKRLQKEQEAEAAKKAEEEAKAAEEAAKQATVSASVPTVSMSAISGASSSTYLSEPEYNLVHDASKLFDGDTTTAWVEGVSGQGIGEFITVSLSGEYMVSGLKIYNGHQYSGDIYNKNSRPANITISCSDGTSYTVDLSDSFGQQTITFGEPQKTSSITITINSVYSGTKYEDTCISELSLF